ncbi:hypothetical protein Q1695_001906 [Nippostrongylus brasiliensis]|nr:hypothetical protein Q1695_001906 [Nippostrongylus brasiliensis]
MASSGGGGSFMSLFQAFKKECRRYAKQKRIHVEKEPKIINIGPEANAERLTANNFAELLPDVDTFIFGADGLMWLREGVIHEASSLINLLIEKKKNIIILTNDTTRTRDEHVDKLVQHRFSSKITKDRLVTPGLVAAEHIENTCSYSGKKVYVVAAEGVEDELKNRGIEYFGQGEPATSGPETGVFDTDLGGKREDVCAVIVGFDTKFNFKKMLKAVNYLKNPNCIFLATNDDATFAVQNSDIVVPDAGAIVASISKGAAREPIIVGKPSQMAYEFIKKKFDIDEERTMVICSRISNDVKFGRLHGMRTLLVLNEAHQMEELDRLRSGGQLDLLPHYYAPSLAEILPQYV